MQVRAQVVDRRARTEHRRERDQVGSDRRDRGRNRRLWRDPTRSARPKAQPHEPKALGLTIDSGLGCWKGGSHCLSLRVVGCGHIDTLRPGAFRALPSDLQPLSVRVWPLVVIALLRRSDTRPSRRYAGRSEPTSGESLPRPPRSTAARPGCSASVPARRWARPGMRAGPTHLAVRRTRGGTTRLRGEPGTGSGGCCHAEERRRRLDEVAARALRTSRERSYAAAGPRSRSRAPDPEQMLLLGSRSAARLPSALRSAGSHAAATGRPASRTGAANPPRCGRRRAHGSGQRCSHRRREAAACWPWLPRQHLRGLPPPRRPTAWQSPHFRDASRRRREYGGS